MVQKKKTPGGGSGKVRLQKIMAAAGVDSRRACEQMILDGRVTVNGRVVKKLPVLVDPTQDRIIADGRKIKARVRAARPGSAQAVRPAKLMYYILNKPKGVICTNRDATDLREVKRGRQRAIDLMEGVKERLVSVGRLDVESRGLLIMTNDGELVNQLTHPRHEVTKTYRLRIDGALEAADIDRLTKGLWMTSQRPGQRQAGGQGKAANVKVVHRDLKHTVLEVVMREGKNRQIRRMMSRLGYKVSDLVRIKIGALSVKGVPVGEYRALTVKEVLRLKGSAKAASPKK